MIINGDATANKVKAHIDFSEIDVSYLGMGFLPRVINMEWGARSFAYIRKGCRLSNGKR